MNSQLPLQSLNIPYFFLSLFFIFLHQVRINANEGVLGQRLGSGFNRNDTGGFKKGKSAYAATPGFVDADKYTPGLYAASR